MSVETSALVVGCIKLALIAAVVIVAGWKGEA